MRGNKKIPFLLCLVVKKVQAMLRNKHDDFVAFILRVGLIFLAFFFFLGDEMIFWACLCLFPKKNKWKMRS